MIAREIFFFLVLSLSAEPGRGHELREHGLDTVEGLLPDGLDPVRGQQEAVAPGVRKLDRERVLDAHTALGPVVTATWKEKRIRRSKSPTPVREVTGSTLGVFQWLLGLLLLV